MRIHEMVKSRWMRAELLNTIFKSFREEKPAERLGRSGQCDRKKTSRYPGSQVKERPSKRGK